MYPDCQDTVDRSGYRTVDLRAGCCWPQRILGLSSTVGPRLEDWTAQVLDLGVYIIISASRDGCCWL
jgi:hypothetical protein